MRDSSGGGGARPPSCFLPRSAGSVSLGCCLRWEEGDFSERRKRQETQTLRLRSGRGILRSQAGSATSFPQKSLRSAGNPKRQTANNRTDIADSQNLGKSPAHWPPPLKKNRNSRHA
ncbi:Hypothetical predicted protein [Podarcis lilfordi]|uniref:Uncharacterized protein n=1 Tax=Podarcis lilfordi TaxID=74358 RepID=A0AA35L7B4_9SAUR|nr:Hypothetical predicted protein [Podarcis lilfordi]